MNGLSPITPMTPLPFRIEIDIIPIKPQNMMRTRTDRHCTLRLRARIPKSTWDAATDTSTAKYVVFSDDDIPVESFSTETVLLEAPCCSPASTSVAMTNVCSEIDVWSSQLQTGPRIEASESD